MLDYAGLRIFRFVKKNRKKTPKNAFQKADKQKYRDAEIRKNTRKYAKITADAEIRA
jgi:hypothetical protein